MDTNTSQRTPMYYHEQADTNRMFIKELSDHILSALQEDPQKLNTLHTILKKPFLNELHHFAHHSSFNESEEIYLPILIQFKILENTYFSQGEIGSCDYPTGIYYAITTQGKNLKTYWDTTPYTLKHLPM